MAKNISSIKELVIQTMTNLSNIKKKAEKGESESCFQMGVTHLFGIDTVVDFKKACQYLENKSLESDADANRLLGFITECEGDYSTAFMRYANASSSKPSLSYFDKVLKERENLQGFFKEQNLPIVMNTVISKVFDDYRKGGIPQLNACIKFAVICGDQASYLEVAQSLFAMEDYLSAKIWLQKGAGKTINNPLYISINEKLQNGSKSIEHSLPFQVIDVVDGHLLSRYNTIPSITEVKKVYDNASSLCKNQWIDMIKKEVDLIIHDHEVMEQVRKKKKKKDIKDTISGWFFLSIIVGIIVLVLGLDSLWGIIIAVIWIILTMLVLWGMMLPDSKSDKKK